MDIENVTSVNEDGATPEPDHYAATLNQDGTTTITDLTPNTGEDVATSNYSALQAVRHALEQKPLEFENMVKVGLSDRLQDTVEKRREEVAQAIFTNSDQEVDANDDDAEEGSAQDDQVDDQSEE